jgi:hypothetical protein
MYRNFFSTVYAVAFSKYFAVQLTLNDCLAFAVLSLLLEVV